MSEEEVEGTTAIDTSKRDVTPPSKTIDNTDKGGNGGGKKRDGFYIFVILLLLIGGGWLGYLLSEKNKSINECGNERAQLEQEMEELNEMMYDQGLELGDDVKMNLQNMLTMYDKMEESNTELNDSIAAQKEKIQGLLTELEDVKGDKKHYMSKVYKLQKETETLRSIMKDYIRTIDSLNVANGKLTLDLENMSNDLDNMTKAHDNLAIEKAELSDKVNKGSKLVASGFVTEGIKEKSSGSYKETSKASRCTHIRSCFTLSENSIASPGNKTVYMRVITPDGSVLYSSNANTITTEKGQSILYSDKKTVNYQNQSVDLCIFHKLTSEIGKGNYVAQIYCEGVMIGTDNFVLK
ncbi:MAG: hypothetical protein MI810_10405 [Flavobacteriales bacterium]|nr:hypothetical protein [Flavobacteriales bacterium]